MSSITYRGDSGEFFVNVEVYHDVAPAIAGISMRDFFLDETASVAAWKKAEKYLTELFSDRVRLPISPPPVSYAHLNCLGAEIAYPENGEPNVKPAASTVDEAIEFMLRGQEVDFASQPIIGRYSRIVENMKKAFPERKFVFSGPSHQGPVTTAVLLRGQDFFCDLYDEPEKCKTLLALCAQSIVRYSRFISKMNGVDPSQKTDVAVCDDFAALVTPDLWTQFVLPYWNIFYEGTGRADAKRLIHCEGMIPAQLQYLKQAKISHYQPSVSEMITPAVAAQYKGVYYDTFDLLLYAFKITDMTDEQISAWVAEAVSAGALRLRTQYGAFCMGIKKEDRILAFLDACGKYRV